MSLFACVSLLKLKLARHAYTEAQKFFHIHRQYCRFAIASTDLIVNPAGPISLFTIVSAGSDAPEFPVIIRISQLFCVAPFQWLECHGLRAYGRLMQSVHPRINGMLTWTTRPPFSTQKTRN